LSLNNEFKPPIREQKGNDETKEIMGDNRRVLGKSKALWIAGLGNGGIEESSPA
jgi:hypothetical protein